MNANLYYDESPRVFERHREMYKLPDPYALPDNEQDEAILGSTYITQMKEAHRKKVARTTSPMMRNS